MTALIASILVSATALYLTRTQPAAMPHAPATPAAIAPTAKPATTRTTTTPPAVERPAPAVATTSTTTVRTRPHAVIPEPRTAAPVAEKAQPLAPVPHPTDPNNHDPISGIRILELTVEEMARLGITVKGNEVSVQGEERYTIENPKMARSLAELGYDTTKGSGLVRLKVTAGPAHIENRWLPNPHVDTISKVVPIIVSSDWVEEDKAHRTESAALSYLDRSPLLELFNLTPAQLNANLFQNDTSYEMRSHDERTTMLAGRLIPIRVRLEPTADAPTGSGDCMLWYFPTEEFVAALPERYAKPLREELALIAGVREQALPEGEICRRLTGETFFDYCRKSSGALMAIAAYPNPAHDNVTCRYSLTEGRTISFALYDISGNHLRDLAEARRVEAGEHEAALSLTGARSGTYLIVMKTDKGEQVIQRVIVE